MKLSFSYPNECMFVYLCVYSMACMSDILHMHPIDWRSKLNFLHSSPFQSNAELADLFIAKFPLVYQHTFGVDIPWSDLAVRDVVRAVDPTSTYCLGPASSPREQLVRFYWATVGKVVAFHTDSDALANREDADVHEVLARVVASLVNSHPDVRTHITEFPTMGVHGITRCPCGSKWKLSKDGWGPSCPAKVQRCANYSPTSPCYGPCNCTNCATPLDQPAAKKAKVDLKPRCRFCAFSGTTIKKDSYGRMACTSCGDTHSCQACGVEIKERGASNCPDCE
jgi:hypothetical protein